ncbi:PqqD family protein [Litoreibacter arenae]|uniref:PqqD family protein n=1 Tax=Litoreibacter arenae DSM 19593 TaxID=1123360 RepID=S9RY94_9RHOB|nr:PqqD family protein [Litoreibacter arenae]EPX78954.1 hypothetical protein thalar_01770 [Litoreibacter arenae DSM 19593]
MARLLRQNEWLDVRQLEGQIFLIDEEGGRIHHLNETASALWRLLDTPATRKEVVAEFRFLFPEEDPVRLKSAIKGLLRDLVETGILKKSERQPPD